MFEKNVFRFQLKEKDDQIDQLVERVNELHNHNTRFAEEHERLRNQRCDQCQEFSHNLSALQEQNAEHFQENQQLRDDVKMMKTLVYRLNVQLERHQDILRQTMNENEQNYYPIDFTAQNDTPQRTTKAALDWGTVNAHTLGPLLQVYFNIKSNYKPNNSLFLGL